MANKRETTENIVTEQIENNNQIEKQYVKMTELEKIEITIGDIKQLDKNQLEKIENITNWLIKEIYEMPLAQKPETLAKISDTTPIHMSFLHGFAKIDINKTTKKAIEIFDEILINNRIDRETDRENWNKNNHRLLNQIAKSKLPLTLVPIIYKAKNSMFKTILLHEKVKRLPTETRNWKNHGVDQLDKRIIALKETYHKYIPENISYILDREIELQYENIATEIIRFRIKTLEMEIN